MLPANEQLSVRASAAVRGENGFFFGTLLLIEGPRMVIEVDAVLDEYEMTDVRITLAPSPGTALLRARVLRPLVTARGEASRYAFEVIEVAASDREPLQAWLRNIKGSGTFSQFGSALRKRRDDPMGQQSTDEVRKSLGRLARRGTPSSSPAEPGATAADPFGTGGDGNAPPPSGGRTAVRDALRDAIGKGAPVRPAVVSPPVGAPPAAAPVRPAFVPPPVGAPPRAAPPAPAVRPPAAPPVPATDPTYASTQTRAAQWLEVRWQDPAVFARDARDQLCNYALSLARGSNPLPEGAAIQVILRHRDVHLECAAQILAIGAHGATYRLALDALQAEHLRRWVLTYGKK